MANSELMALVAPPKDPIECGDKDIWKLIKSKLGLDLPNDYFEYGVTYGSGTICNGFFTIANWAAPHYLDFVAQETEFIRGAGTVFTEKLPVHPDPGGLLPWGRDENGILMCWKTEGDSKSWPVVVHSMEGRSFDFSNSMSEFLTQVFSNNVKCPFWHEPFDSAELNFEPSPQ